MDQILGEYLPIASAIVALLAFIVSLITETIKNLAFLKKIPTNLVVLTIAIIISLITYFAAASYCNYKITWYGIIGSFLGGFVVNYISTYGWEKFNALYLRYQRRKEEQKKKNSKGEEKPV
jgi:cell shape-determining protein MreD